MTKKLLLAVVAVLTALLPQGLFAQAEIPLSESFEDGWPPEGWIVESDEGSGLSWFVERGDTSMYPAGATDGTMRAAYDLVKKFNPKKIYVNFIIELTREGLHGRDNFDKDTEITTLLKV